jgi:hypothetical protein
VGFLCEIELELDIFCRVRARVLGSSSVGVEPLGFGEQVDCSGQEVVIVVFQADLRLGIVEDSDGVLQL